MTSKRFALRILLAPLVLLLTPVSFLLAMLLAVSTRLLAIASSVTILFALLVFLSGNNPNGLLILGAMICPYGLPLIAEQLWKTLDSLRGALCRFVFARQ